MSLSDRINVDDVVAEQSPAVDPLWLQIAVEKFHKAFRQRSFSERNPELGKMIKCALCGRRHRETQCHMKEQIFTKNKKGVACDARVVENPRHIRGTANPFWRAHPGVFQFIPGVNKFVRIVS